KFHFDYNGIAPWYLGYVFGNDTIHERITENSSDTFFIYKGLDTFHFLYFEDSMCIADIKGQEININRIPPLSIVSLNGGIEDSSYCNSTEVLLQLQVTGNADTIFWYQDDKLLHGGDSLLYRILDFAAADSGNYFAIAKSVCDSVKSETVSLNYIQPLKIKPLYQPTAMYCDSSEAIFEVEIEGNFDTIFWYKDNILLQRGDSLSYRIPVFTKEDEGYYYAVASDVCGKIQTEKIKADYIPPLSINSLNGSGSYCNSTEALLKLQITGNADTIFWYKNNKLLHGGDSLFYYIVDFTAVDSGNYYVIAKSVCDSVKSETISLDYIQPLQIKPLYQPTAMYCDSSEAIFEVEITSGNLDTIFWYKDGKLLQQGDSLFYYIPAFTQESEGEYYAVASDVCGDVQTEKIKAGYIPPLKVKPLYMPASYCDSAEVLFEVDMFDGMSVSDTVSWYKNNELLQRSSSLSYYIPAFTKQDQGNYYTVASDTCGPVRTAPVKISRSLSMDSIIEQRWNNLFFVSNKYDSFVDYQWYKNGEAIEGATKVWYSVGDVLGDELDFEALYKVRMINIDGDTLWTCEWLAVRTPKVVLPAEIAVYPNPAKTRQMITVENAEEVFLHDLAGNLLGHYKGDKFFAPNKAGVYMIKTNDGLCAKIIVLQ
ncbi:MAG: hypothetical protein LBR45_04630, partial [Bacteroidales bacterium]|nr:hypothetical protein [Bacteroidales bacterium]